MSIILSILFSASLVICFKYFEKYQVNTLHAVTVNYGVACLLGFILADRSIVSFQMFNEGWFHFSFSMGIIFIISFMAISVAAQRIAISASMVASKMSIVIPLTYAVVFVGEPFTLFKFLAVILSMVGVVLTVIRKNDAATEKNKLAPYMKIVLPVVIFVGSGLVDTSFKYISVNYMNTVDPGLIMGVCYGGAFVCGILYNTYRSVKSGIQLKPRSIIAGIILGSVNYFSFFYVLKALHSTGIDSTTLFPVINTGVLLVSTFYAILLFNEKLSRLNIIGFIISLIAILIIALEKQIM